MAQGRIRRLATRLLKWVWVPIVAFVLVVGVAMFCAVWSPAPQPGTEFASPRFGRDIAEVPRALRRYEGELISGYERIGFGVSMYRFTAYEAGVEPRLLSNVSACTAGVPFRCLRWTRDLRNYPQQASMLTRGIGPKSFYSRRIPLLPEPIGMVLNVLIVSAAIVLVPLAWRRVVIYRESSKASV